ncbi:MAG: enoyl-CoA hydratase-related protein [Thermodesulfobacteriota bacterium]|nr:enoyl-CoA hydratase-related protein [Thermodesulfobacteriota bacterium]
MDFKTIKFEEPEPGIGLLTLNRPECLNAHDMDMVDDLHDFYARIARMKHVRVLIITGKGRAFCAGADLKDKRILGAGAMQCDTRAHLENVQFPGSGMITAMRRIPQPIIAAVNGVAAGGGFCFALASDVIIAGASAGFINSFINIGLSGGEFGGTYFLPRLVGATRAAEILLTGRTVSAAEAEKIGLVTRMVPDESLMDSAMETARMMAAKSGLGLQLTKGALTRNIDAPSLEAALELEDRNQTICAVSPEFKDAVKKFALKK